MNFINKILNLIINNNDNNNKESWYDLYGNNVPPKLEYPEGSMYKAFYKTCKKYPRYRAYKYYGKSCNYIKLNKKIVNAAKSLKAIGVKKGDRITICMPNTPDAVVLFYAVNLVGGVANMVHPLSSEQEILHCINKSNSKYLLCLDMLYPKIECIMDQTKLKKVIISKISNEMHICLKIIYPFISKKYKVCYSKKFISWKNFNKLGKTYTDEYKVKMHNKDDAVILYSGGTTGDSKGVVLTNLNFNALATQCFKMADPAKAGDSILTIMPIFHGFGLGVCIHTALISGMNVILVPQFKSKDFSKMIKRNKPAFLAGVPTMYEALINSKERSKTYLSSVINVICGGDVLNETLKDKVDSYLKEHGSKANIRVGYGLTECTGASCLTPRYYFKEGGIGIPLPDMYYKIVRVNTYEKANVNEDGEICISGPTVMKGYLNDEDETKKVLKRHDDGRLWLHTGDIGCMNEEGLVFFKSRLKRIIVSSGYNIYPQYIEKVIMSHPSVSTCVVVGIDHPYKKQVPKAYIVLRDNFEDTKELRNDIKEYCTKSIAKYSLPYEYEYVSELPKTLIGKVAFTKLGKEAKNGK